VIPLTLGEIAEIVGGEVRGDPAVTVTGPAFVDSRSPVPGGLFAAFVGEHVDGHRYAEAAVAGGAAAVLATGPVTGSDVPLVLVDDAQAALATLAHEVLARLARARVVALTGSQGKTSTKDLLAQVLAAAGTTVATEGSFNNELGLPLTVLRAEDSTDFLVLEMGARGRGHLALLCRIAPPHVSLVLNVGKAHLGEFGSQEAIAQAKGEIVEALTAGGLAVLNADDPLVRAMADRCAGQVLLFGEAPDADLRLTDLEVDELGRPRFRLTGRGATTDVALRLVGEHQAANALAAAAVAVGLGVDLSTVGHALSRATPASRWRMEVHERQDGVTVINDAYNANPDSMRAALKALAAVGRGRGPGTRTVAVLGEMRELGASSREEHDAVGRLAVRLDISQLVVVGESARPLHLGACLEGSWADESVFVEDNEQALDWLRDHVVPGDVVLFKASRAAALETVAEALLADRPEPQDDAKEPGR
jgi:UDP-N-acetylmuramoyl-tripeptide--D-alanyl-D-alanine ligase